MVDSEARARADERMVLKLSDAFIQEDDISFELEVEYTYVERVVEMMKDNTELTVADVTKCLTAVEYR